MLHETRHLFSKQVDNQLVVSLLYPDGRKDRCRVTFHNILDEFVVVESPQKENRENENENELQGWLSSWFGLRNYESDSGRGHSIRNKYDKVKVLLGNIQLTGYVILNGKFSKFSDDEVFGKDPWWKNTKYDSHYQNSDYVEEDLDAEHILERVPFIRKNSANKMMVGGHVGGIHALGGSPENMLKYIGGHSKYFLLDLLFPFNSVRAEFDSEGEKEGKKTLMTSITFEDLADIIVPFYITPQSLLFTDLELSPGMSKSFDLCLPKLMFTVPSYNNGMVRPVCDQGWVSIRYLLIIGFLQKNEADKINRCNIYFPYEVKSDRVGTDKRWLQPNYLRNITIDSNWKVRVLSSEEQMEEEKEINTSNISSKLTFVEHLSSLISSKDSEVHDLEEKIDFFSTDTTPQQDLIHNCIPQIAENQRTLFQVRINEQDLCILKLSKPYFHVGEDIYFEADVTPSFLKERMCVGLSAHVEAHENFSTVTKTTESNIFTNSYKVTPTVKLNSFASCLGKLLSIERLQNHGIISGNLHLPRFLTQQFQSTGFMELKYYLVFKFVLTKHFPVTKEKDSPECESEDTLRKEVEPSSPILQKKEFEGKWEHVLKSHIAGAYGDLLTFVLPLTVLPSL